MAKCYVTGRLGSVKTRGQNNEYISFGVKEPSYQKAGSDEWVDPWFNFLVKADSSIGKFLKANETKIDVVEVTSNERQDSKDSSVFYHNVVSVDVITWKKADTNASTNTNTVDSLPQQDQRRSLDDVPKVNTPNANDYLNGAEDDDLPWADVEE